MIQRILTFLSILSLSLQMTAQLAISFPGEFEKNEGVLLVWDYSPSRDSVVANMAAAIQPVAKAWIIYYPATAPMDTTDIRNYLLSRGVGYENVHFIPAWTETLWVRDFGPFTGYGVFEDAPERFFYDAGYSQYGRPKDDSVPSQIGNYWNIPTVGLNLEFEGGNLLLDGLSNGFATKRIYSQNPLLTPEEIEQQLKDAFNLQSVVFLDVLNHSGGGIWKHVDMFMKVLDYETIMVSSYPDSLPDYPVIESNVEILSQTQNYFQNPYKIVRIPAPPKEDGTFATTQNDEMRTYTNSLIINNVIIVPSYNLPEYDSVAKQIYEAQMPGYIIKMVDARTLTPLFGALHCISKEIPQERLLKIVHEKVEGPQTYASDFAITCLANCDSLVQEMWLHYKLNDDSEFQTTPIHLVCPTHYGVIEGLLPTDTVHYYIEGRSGLITVTYPLSSPDGYFTFWFDVVGEKEPVSAVSNYTVYPNPSAGKITIVAPAGNERIYIRLNNMHGELVYQGLVNTSQTVDLQHVILPGIYFLQINTRSTLETKKVIFY
ncbi:MAG: agmatine deiminase family protein [Bacteroidetes bacterium]|nr:agmatine deiminase family protein [Bacteroidota bacterium]